MVLPFSRCFSLPISTSAALCYRFARPFPCLCLPSVRCTGGAYRSVGGAAILSVVVRLPLPGVGVMFTILSADGGVCRGVYRCVCGTACITNPTSVRFAMPEHTNNLKNMLAGNMRLCAHNTDSLYNCRNIVYSNSVVVSIDKWIYQDYRGPDK